MRHLVIAALMILGSLLAVQTTIGTLEQMALRGHDIEDVSSPPSATREMPRALHVPTALAAPSRESLRLPTRPPAAQLADNRS